MYLGWAVKDHSSLLQFRSYFLVFAIIPIYVSINDVCSSLLIKKHQWYVENDFLMFSKLWWTV